MVRKCAVIVEDNVTGSRHFAGSFESGGIADSWIEKERDKDLKRLVSRVYEKIFAKEPAQRFRKLRNPLKRSKAD